MKHATTSIAFALTAFGLGCANKPITLPGELSPPPACASQGQSACEAACEADDAGACAAASVRYGAKSRHADAARMQEYELKGCELGNALACHWYANNFTIQGPERDLEKAEVYMGKACEGGDFGACRWLISAGLGVDDGGRFLDAAAARAVWQSACDRGEPFACTGLADLVALGVGGERDIGAARKLYEAACTPQAPGACENAESLDRQIQVNKSNLRLFETLHFVHPDFALEGVGSDWKATVVLRACFGKTDPNPSSVAVVESTGNAEIDEIVEQSTQRWRLKVRPDVPDGVTLCVRMRYELVGG